MLQILHRSKDGKTPYEPEDKKISQQTVKTYYISSPEYLDYKMAEIRDLCEMFNARAYINLNKKSWRQISLKSLGILAGIIEKADNNPDEWRGVKTIIDSACGQTGACDKNKTWVLDIDTKEEKELTLVKGLIGMCEPLDTEKVVDVLPTIHGYHIISKPFNKQKFMMNYETIHKIANEPVEDIIKDNNPTILYVETQN
jgi:hypothetical protein